MDWIEACQGRSTMTNRISPSVDAFSATGNWTREQTLLAFQFYCENPFGQLHGRNRKIIELSKLIGRSADALAMKCVNIASLDPKIRESGRAGLSNASALDREIWTEAHENWEQVIEECEELRAYLHSQDSLQTPSRDAEYLDIEPDFTGETRLAIVKQRVKQEFFRRAVLSSYAGRCCISGVTDTRFLVASHIVPWKDDAKIRLHPGNGLCLSAIHDKAFDRHLFSLTDDHCVMLSRQMRNTEDEFLRKIFLPIEGERITMPDKFVPEPIFVAQHRARMTEIGS